MEKIDFFFTRHVIRWGLPALVFLLLLSTPPRPLLGALQSSQDHSPAPPVEAKGPIIAIVTASSIDAKGEIVNPRFTFPPNEPQITAIVYLGKINASQLKVAWYKTSDNRDDRLFEHQIQVKSNERAFSVARNVGGTLELGTYKVVATLEGQTEETEFDVSPPKQQNKSSNAPDELFDHAQSDVIDRTYPVGTNSRRRLTTTKYLAGLKGQTQKLAWSASGQAARLTKTAITVLQGKRPMAGTSGTAPQPAIAPTVPASGCEVKVYGGEIIRPRDFIADTVQIQSEAACQSASVVHVQATVRGLLQEVGSYPVAAGQSASAIFNVDPCWLPGATDLPGTEVSIQAVGEEVQTELRLHYVAKGVITLFNDISAPSVNVVSTPARGTTVKTGDKINLQVAVQERRRKGPWQTGIKVIQVTAIPGGLVKEPWVNPSNLPKPCNAKTWEQKYEATYTVPSNPPPTIKICAIAEDYVGNESSQCGEFYAEDKSNAMPANCRSKGDAHVGQEDGTPLGDGSKVTCRIDYYICGVAYKKTLVVDNASDACKSFFDSVKANLPKQQFCCDCYPKCTK